MENVRTASKIKMVIHRTKTWIKTNRRSNSFLVRKVADMIYRVGTLVFDIKGILISKQRREIFGMTLFKSGRVHQTTPATCLNRFPVIFTACKNYFDKKKEIKILSFGCSTGEEVITLRHYFPDATIVGAEINQNSLEICQKRKLDSKMLFIDSTDRNIQINGPYDAIFCMAVFQRTPQSITEQGIKSLKRIYPFEKFDKQICMLDECVKKDGLMVVHFSQYDFLDTAVASKYDIWGDYNQDSYTHHSAIFDKNSQLMIDKQRRYSIFIKKQ